MSEDNGAIEQLLDRRSRALADIRQRLSNTKIQERDVRARLRDTNLELQSIKREKSPPNGHVHRRWLKGEAQLILAELQETAEVETQLSDLLSRLADLKHIHATKGRLALCEQCQEPIPAEMLRHCAPEGSQWDVCMALLICPNCLQT